MSVDVPWLRLVYDAHSLSSARSKKAEQLSLPFPKSDVVIMLDTKQVRHTTFLFVLGLIRPHWVFDLRFNPRLDVLAGSRSEAFRHFKDLGMHYVDVFGFMDLSERKMEIRRKRRFISILREHLAEVKDNNGPYLALLDDEDIREVVVDSAKEVITTLTGRDISLSQVAVSGEIHARF